MSIGLKSGTIPYALCMECLPTFGLFISIYGVNVAPVNIPYMEHLDMFRCSLSVCFSIAAKMLRLWFRSRPCDENVRSSGAAELGVLPHGVVWKCLGQPFPSAGANPSLPPFRLQSVGGVIYINLVLSGPYSDLAVVPEWDIWRSWNFWHLTR